MSYVKQVFYAQLTRAGGVIKFCSEKIYLECSWCEASNTKCKRRTRCHCDVESCHLYMEFNTKVNPWWLFQYMLPLAAERA